jgi:hypothetical protein
MKIGKLKYLEVGIKQPGDQFDPLIVFSDELDLDKYNDITSISSWKEHGLMYGDFFKFRDQMISIYNDSGFENLSIEDKLVASEFFIASKTERSEVYTQIEQKQNWDYFVQISYDTRVNRWEAAKSYISFVLEPIDSLDIGKSTDQLSTDYKLYGIKNVTESGIPGLFDWLENTSIYAYNGYSSKSYWTQEDQDNLINILRNGNY